jgi:hypothetical protein
MEHRPDERHAIVFLVTLVHPTEKYLPLSFFLFFFSAYNQCFGSGSVFDSRLDPDSYSECGSESRRAKKKAPKRQIVRYKKD